MILKNLKKYTMNLKKWPEININIRKKKKTGFHRFIEMKTNNY